MTPRQERLLVAIRECLGRETAWVATDRAIGNYRAAHAPADARAADRLLTETREAYAEERARTLVGVIEELDHERDAAVRALVEAAAFLVEYADDGQPSYGYYCGGDPRDFHPDEECCSPAEIEAHRAACEAWDRGETPDPGGPHQPLTREDVIALEMAMGVARENPPEMVGHKTVAHYGVGTMTYRDPRLDAIAAALAEVRRLFPEGE